MVVAVVALAHAACSRTPSARQRALAKLPASVTFVGAADGAALASPAFRAVIDLSRPRLPDGFGCVVDAALGAEAVAIAADREGIAVVIVGGGVTGCPDLSRVADDTWVATIGAATVDQAPAILDDDRWRRARSYLLSAPVAFAVDRDGQRAIFAAQADPLSAWLALDVQNSAVIEQAVRGYVAMTKAHLEVTRSGDQIVVRGDHLRADELASTADALERIVDRPPAPPQGFECPPAHGLLSACAGNDVTVTALPSVIALLGRSQPAIDGGEIIGMRLLDDEVFLRKGDIIREIDEQRVTSVRDILQHARPRSSASLVVRRGPIDFAIRLLE